ncbi:MULTISPECIES: glycosyltransferase [Clostridium]|uniref:glycosyltransferase n=1 Tax=Clostridium TaxID=1485 RepID=UPI001897030D|nr:MULTISPECIES: glycosyltransferase [Clostridium]MDB2124231.1 glycosyltransferase [Clostridium paraputrificum]MDC0801307.1 glycosyltransferase [Clostridium paraputrificum]MDU1585122.1 glycosyltransferase [Clostridium sp.]
MNTRDYSVLMSIYKKTTVQELCSSIDSILNQTVFPEQFVIVCDGTLEENVEKELGSYVEQYKKLFTVVRLDKNQGLANALNQGILVCRNELIARMDSDDISLPRRCELQLNAFDDDSNLALLGTATYDFNDKPEISEKSYCSYPTEYEEIKKVIRRNDPFAHPTIMYKKDVVCNCGMYDPSLRRRQDYDLFSKMINKGYIAKNLKEGLLLYKFDDSNFSRIRSWESCKSRINVQKRIYERGECSLNDFMYIYIAMLITRIIPTPIYKAIYKFIKEKEK